MTEFELAQLRRLPQRAEDTWEGGWCRLPFRARIAGRGGAQFRLALWGSLETGEINRAPDPCAVEEATPERLFTALVRFAIDKEAAGYRPGVVQVCDAALAEAWREPLAGVGITVELVPGLPEDLPALAPLLRAMGKDFGSGDGQRALVNAPGVTIERLRSLAEAAREFYLARPWDQLDGDDDPIRVLAPPPRPGRAVVAVMGSMGQEYGLTCFGAMEDFLDMVRAPDDEDLRAAARSQERWSLAFGSEDEMPVADVEAWRRHDLPLAHADAWPALFHLVPPDSFPPPEPADLTYFEALLRAIARATEDQLDAGRWRATVPTHDGPVDVELELPELLSPPSWEEMLRRGWQPDRRAHERLNMIIARRFEENPPASMEEANAFLARMLGNQPVPDMPFEPRDDWERAQELCYQAFDSQGRRRQTLARRALAECPDCADAYVLLAERTADLERALELFTAGAAAGPRCLSAERQAEGRGELWGDTRARPWLRAVFGRATTLARLRRFAESRAACNELLELDKRDPLGARKLKSLLLKEERRSARGARGTSAGAKKKAGGRAGGKPGGKPMGRTAGKARGKSKGESKKRDKNPS